MHVPDVGQAISELARVVPPGGVIAVSEGDMHSLQATALRLVKKALGRERAKIVRTPAGLEFWEETEFGQLLTRQADIS